MKKYIFALLLIIIPFLLQAQTVPYRIVMPSSSYSAQLRGITGSRTAGLTITGSYSSTFKAHVFTVSVEGRYNLYYDAAGGSTYTLDTGWSGPYGKFIAVGDFNEAIDTDADNKVDQLDDNSVTAATITDSVISLAKMTQAAINYIGSGGNVVNNPDDVTIENSGPTTLGVKDSSITSAKIATGTILKGNIANDAIDSTKIGIRVIQGDNIANNQISNFKIDNSIYSMFDQMAKNPLNIPTYDDNPSTTHLSVVFKPSGWNNYRYWMAHTPYPNETRENPSIVASNDGVNWIEPNGIVNPVADRDSAQVDGHTAQSDPDLMFKGDTLFMYYREMYGTPQEEIYLMWSVDGTTWSKREAILTSGTDTSIDTLNYWLSPSFLNFGDTLFYMWCVADTGTGWDGDYKMFRYQSTDGRNWTNPTACDYGRSEENQIALWHMDIVYENDFYYALAVERLKYNFRYKWLISSDGLTWNLKASTINRINADSTDRGGNYRGSLVAIPGNPLSFKIWGVGVDDDDGSVFLATHRAIYFDNVPAPDTLSAASETIFLPAYDAFAYVGSPTDTTINFRQHALSFHNGQQENVLWNTKLPESWEAVNVYLVYFPITNTTGDIVINYSDESMLPTYNASSWGGGFNSTVTITAGSQYIVQKQFLQTTILYPNTYYFRVRMARDGDGASDTFNGSVGVVGLILEKS